MGFVLVCLFGGDLSVWLLLFGPFSPIEAGGFVVFTQTVEQIRKKLNLTLL